MWRNPRALCWRAFPRTYHVLNVTGHARGKTHGKVLECCLLATFCLGVNSTLCTEGTFRLGANTVLSEHCVLSIPSALWERTLCCERTCTDRTLCTERTLSSFTDFNRTWLYWRADENFHQMWVCIFKLQIKYKVCFLCVSLMVIRTICNALVDTFTDCNTLKRPLSGITWKQWRHAIMSQAWQNGCSLTNTRLITDY